jgi:uncharacterized DUF497 family protein
VFEWDAKKAAANLAKHGVSFDEGATVFADSEALDGPDLLHSAGEARFLRLGKSVAARVLMVATRRGDREMSTRSASSAPGGRAGRKGPRMRTRRRIDLSDLPEASDDQLRAMRRVGRPPLGDRARQLIAIRLDPTVLARFRQEAKRRSVGYQTLINRVLADYVRHHVI